MGSRRISFFLEAAVVTSLWLLSIPTTTARRLNPKGPKDPTYSFKELAGSHDPRSQSTEILNADGFENHSNSKGATVLRGLLQQKHMITYGFHAENDHAFVDVGPGCCAAREPTKMLFKGMVSELNACKEKCQSLATCGTIEFGWNNSNWCTVIPEGTDCKKLVAGPKDCGDAGGDNGVHTYVYSVSGEEVDSAAASTKTASTITPTGKYIFTIVVFVALLVVIFMLFRFGAKFYVEYSMRRETTTQPESANDNADKSKSTTFHQRKSRLKAGTGSTKLLTESKRKWVSGTEVTSAAIFLDLDEEPIVSAPRNTISYGAPLSALSTTKVDFSEPPASSSPPAEPEPESSHDNAEKNEAHRILPVLSGAQEIRYKDDFMVQGPDGVKRTFSWATPKDAEDKKLVEACAPFVGVQSSTKSELLKPIAAPWVPQTLVEILTKYGVDTEKWTQEKVEKLAIECAGESCFLMVDSKRALHRVIDFVAMVIVHEESGYVLAAENSKNPEFTNATEYRKKIVTQEAMPTMRRQSGESLSQTADRCLAEKVGAPGGAVKLDWGNVKTVAMEETGDWFPGLTTVVRRSIVKGVLATADQKVLTALGAATKSLSMSSYKSNYRGQVFQWNWKPMEKVPELMKHRSWLNNIHVTQFGKHQTSSPQSQEIDDLRVIVPWTMEEVEALLQEFDCTAADFNMSVSDIAQEASFCSCYFCKRISDSKLILVQDQVMLRVISSQGQGVLTLRDSSGAWQWPSTFRRLDETTWDSVRRLARVQLGLVDDSIEFCLTPQELYLDGERQVQRTFLMSGHIPEGKTNMCEVLHASRV